MAVLKKYSKYIVVFILILLINIHSFSFAFLKEEETDYIWLEEEITNVSSNKVDEPKLNSRCAVVFDRNSKSIIFGKNENKRVPMASTTKIITAIVLLEYLENNNIGYDTQVEVCKEAGAIGRF